MLIYNLFSSKRKFTSMNIESNSDIVANCTATAEPMVGSAGFHSSSLEHLESIGFHHIGSQYVNQLPSDPFAASAYENALLYVPEVVPQ